MPLKTIYNLKLKFKNQESNHLSKKVDASCLQLLNTGFTHPSSEASMQLTMLVPRSLAFTRCQELAKHCSFGWWVKLAFLPYAGEQPMFLAVYHSGF